MQKLTRMALFTSMLFLSGCGGINSLPFLSQVGITLIVALIFYTIAILFIPIGVFIKDRLMKVIPFEEKRIKASLVTSFFVFVILSFPLLYIDSDLAHIFSYLILSCSFAFFLGMYKPSFRQNLFYLFEFVLILILIFLLDMNVF